MALILKNDVLYLHVPKTGGNWLTATLKAEDLIIGSISHKHATYDYVVYRGTVMRQRAALVTPPSYPPWRLRVQELFVRP
jgi:hypothetical protein